MDEHLPGTAGIFSQTFSLFHQSLDHMGCLPTSGTRAKRVGFSKPLFENELWNYLEDQLIAPLCNLQFLSRVGLHIAQTIPPVQFLGKKPPRS
jgi:hypothetical protein